MCVAKYDHSLRTGGTRIITIPQYTSYLTFIRALQSALEVIHITSLFPVLENQMDESLLRNHLNCTNPICVPLKNNGILEYAHSPNSTPLPVSFYLPQTKSFCSQGGGIPVCLAGLQAHTQGGGRGVWLVGGLQANTQGQVEGSGWGGVSRPTPRRGVERSGRGGLQAHTQGVCIQVCTEADTPPPSRRLLHSCSQSFSIEKANNVTVPERC